jgi:succinyl-diaminopimelate desuccinylase
LADNAIERAAAGITALAAHEPVPHSYAGLVFREVAPVTRIAGGIAGNVIPDRVDCHVNFRYAPGRTPQEAEARLAELCGGHGELRITSNAPSGAVPRDNPLLERLKRSASCRSSPSRPGRPSRSSRSPDMTRSTSAPAPPERAHRRDESVEISALVRCARVLERFARELE